MLFTYRRSPEAAVRYDVYQGYSKPIGRSIENVEIFVADWMAKRGVPGEPVLSELPQFPQAGVRATYTSTRRQTYGDV